MFPSRPFLQRGVKVYPMNTSPDTMSFQDLWRQAEQNIKLNPFIPDVEFFDSQEKYAWVDERLEELSSHVEEEDDECKDATTFDYWNEECLASIDTAYLWVDWRLEELSSRVEEEDDDTKNAITFQI